MVKKKGLLVFALGAMMAMGHMSAPTASSGMKEFAEDYAANKGVGLHVLRAEGAGFEYSPTYVQSGVNEAGEDVLRFATAVKGEVESLSYTRFALEGAAPGSAQAMDNVVPVTTLYKSIEVSEGSAYYDGAKVVGEATEATEGWYWACYSITYTSSTFKASDVKVQLTVNESEALEERSMSLNKVKLPNMEGYIVDGAGNKYSGSYVSFEVLDKYTAKAAYSGFEVEAAITDEDGEYLVFGDSENGFKASFSYNRVNIKDFIYEGEKKISKSDGYDATLLERLSSFYMETYYYNSLNDSGYKRVDTTNPNPVFAGNSVTLYLRNLPSGGVSVSAKSSDESVVAVTSSSSSQVGVEFKKGGYAEVTVTAKDAYGTEKSLVVKYSVDEKVFPNDDNWHIEVSRDLDHIVYTNQITLTVKWDDDSINQDKTVKWSLNDSKLASLSQSKGEEITVTAKSEEGDVVVTATVTGASGDVTKTVEFHVYPKDEDDNSLSDEIVGVWEGYDDYDTYFTFTVEADGSAVLEIEGEEFSFTHDRTSNSEYIFTSDDYDGVEVGIWVTNNEFYLYDDSYVLNFDTIMIYNDYVEIWKQ